MKKFSVVSVFQGFKSRVQQNLNNYKRKLEIGDKIQYILHMRWYSLLVCFRTMNQEGKERRAEKKDGNGRQIYCRYARMIDRS